MSLWLMSAVLATTVRSGPAQGRSPYFEVRGTVLCPEGVGLQGDRAYVQLGNPVGPPVLGSEADSKGRFRIRKVPAGMYLLTAYVPRLARAKRTVEVGPTLADSKGRIEVTLQMESSAARPSRYRVSVDQLSIPEEAQGELEKGLRSLGHGELEKAALDFRRATEIAPSFGAAWNQLGTVEYLRGNFHEAAAHFLEAGKHLPGNFQVLLARGAALLAAHDAKTALSVNSKAVEERPNDAQAQAQLGFSLFLTGRLDDAEAHLKTAVALDPANFLFPQLLLAEIYRGRQDFQSTRRELEEFLRLHPDSPKALEVRDFLQVLRPR